MDLFNLSVQLAPKNKRGLLLKNPVLTASGTFGYGMEYAELFDIQKLGAIVCKGTTLKPRPGNPQPRLAETPSGILNSIGLQNIGVEALIKEIAPIWAGWQVPVIVNIAGESIGEYSQVASRLDNVPGVAALEINISCPNVAAGGLEFGTRPKLASEVVTAVKEVTSLPIIVKLSPNVTDICEIGVAAAKAGADALTAINTLRGMAIDIKRKRPLLGNRRGGLSGPAIKPVALNLVYELAGAVDIPLIGCGGIASADDALEFIMAGADAVQVGTAGFSDPEIALHVIKGIEAFMEREKVNNLSDLVGVARK